VVLVKVVVRGEQPPVLSAVKSAVTCAKTVDADNSSVISTAKQ
jgi:hypothetical protein